MASTSFVVSVLIAALALAAISDGVVLCPSFPSCCYHRRRNGRDSCHALCPSCREAKEFVNGVRKRHKSEQIIEENARRFGRFGRFGRRGRRPGISFIAGDPFAFPNSDIFPSPLVIL